MRIKPRCDPVCANIIITSSTGSVIAWVSEIRYLGVFFLVSVDLSLNVQQIMLNVRSIKLLTVSLVKSPFYSMAWKFVNSISPKWRRWTLLLTVFYEALQHQ